MTRAYDIRPNLESYDALTVRGIAKYAGAVALILGVEWLANHFGLAGWVRGALNLAKAGLGLAAIWFGLKSLVTGRDLPSVDDQGPRYAEPDRIQFISPRLAAAGQILAGALLVADAAVRTLLKF